MKELIKENFLKIEMEEGMHTLNIRFLFILSLLMTHMSRRLKWLAQSLCLFY